MPLPVTVYRWDDPGAPQLVNCTPSEWINILKKCLVDGYGAKAGAGWSIAFEDPAIFKIAFRNSTADGSGGFVQFWSHETTNNDTDSFLYRAAQGMTALDTFIRPGFCEVIKGSYAKGVIDQWMIIATSRGFYLFSLQKSLNTPLKGYISVFIGDFDSFITNDAGTFVGSGGQIADRYTDSTISASTQSLFALELQFRPRLYGTDGNSTATQGGSRYLFPAVPAANTPTYSDTVAGVTMTFVDAIVTGAASNDPGGTSASASLTYPLVRGKLPGLLESSYVGYRNDPFPVTRAIFGQEHMLLPCQTSTGLKMWLNIEEWY